MLPLNCMHEMMLGVRSVYFLIETIPKTRTSISLFKRKTNCVVQGTRFKAVSRGESWRFFFSHAVN